MLELTNQLYARSIALLSTLLFVLANIIEVLYLIPNKSVTFDLTVLATLPIRTASQGGSFAFIAFSIVKDKCPESQKIFNYRLSTFALFSSRFILNASVKSSYFISYE